eukprot:CAMPEP_0170455304 /NCGR_PEP_ID=MMETSP0123-20130129/3314_1 /TAXON_ID=182087 /ORGANISM="Favella ehrenbergii, Strain Fehren 1" /LENGTH=125 /DNA_ID=CAMNT_0010718399 /DNA_START=79 /DNA_END=456 /DNA_ORIENTATION=-
MEEDPCHHKRHEIAGSARLEKLIEVAEVRLGLEAEAEGEEARHEEVDGEEKNDAEGPVEAQDPRSNTDAERDDESHLDNGLQVPLHAHAALKVHVLVSHQPQFLVFFLLSQFEVLSFFNDLALAH